MHSITPGKVQFANGSISCQVSFITEPFKSEVTAFTGSGSWYYIYGYSGNTKRLLSLYLDKDLTEGPHDVGPDKKVSIIYYHDYDSFGWNYRAEEGTFTLNSIDFEKLEIDGTFEFKAPGMEENSEVVVTQGIVKFIGAKG